MKVLQTEQGMRYYGRVLAAYLREAASPRDLYQLLRVRLALSKVGRVACPHAISPTVNLRSFGAVELRSHTTDIAVLAELVVSHAYEPALRLPDGPVATIVDLGANTGLTARWLAQRFPTARIVCVEPEPGNLVALRANMGSQTGATIVPACVGGRRRRVTLDTSAGEFGVTMVDGHPGGTSVDVVTMEDVLAQADMDRVDLLKCDIEGAESELFENCRAWIDRVGTMVVECHGSYRPEHLLGDLARNGANYEIAFREPNPEYGNEVVALRRSAPVGALSPTDTRN